MQRISEEKEENNLLILYQAAIQTMFNTAINQDEIEQLEVTEIIETFKEIADYVETLINSRIRQISMILSENTGQQTASAFDEYDKENGYVTEMEQTEIWQSYIDTLDIIIHICIKNTGNSYKECLESDLNDLLEYMLFEIEYEREVNGWCKS